MRLSQPRKAGLEAVVPGDEIKIEKLENIINSKEGVLRSWGRTIDREDQITGSVLEPLETRKTGLEW